MKHITEVQRYGIHALREQGITLQVIADTMNKHKSSISRELKRNSDLRSGKYTPELAHKKCCGRHETKSKNTHLVNEIKELIDRLLQEEYSPEQIVGFCKKNNIPCVSHERIYQYIWENKKRGGKLHLNLRNQGRKYRKRGNQKDSRGIIKDRISIEQRPEIVDERKRFGDLEVDLIIGKNHEQAILTINDRASGMLKMRKVDSKNAKVVGDAIIEELQEWSPYIKTITADNGKEFANHKAVANTLRIDYYFARPYHSWERGSNENLNGLIRQYFPKKSDFTKLSQQDITQVELKLNSRPRKRHNFETPIFVMNQLLFNDNVAFMT